MTNCDTTLQGYTIPKDTIVLTNLWYQHHNPDIWPEPFTFKPERFLTDGGKLVLAGEPPRTHLFPFGGGPRICPGQTLVMTRLFLFVASIFQKFSILPENAIADQSSVHPAKGFTGGLVLEPRPFKIKMVELK